jgi:hypothetical protein
VSAIDAKGVEGSLVVCLQRVVMDAQFSRPQGGSATLSVPLTFVQQ